MKLRLDNDVEADSRRVSEQHHNRASFPTAIFL
jgi:hypothetical protein